MNKIVCNFTQVSIIVSVDTKVFNNIASIQNNEAVDYVCGSVFGQLKSLIIYDTSNDRASYVCALNNNAQFRFAWTLKIKMFSSAYCCINGGQNE